MHIQPGANDEDDPITAAVLVQTTLVDVPALIIDAKSGSTQAVYTLRRVDLTTTPPTVTVILQVDAAGATIGVGDEVTVVADTVAIAHDTCDATLVASVEDELELTAGVGAFPDASGVPGLPDPPARQVAVAEAVVDADSVPS